MWPLTSERSNLRAFYPLERNRERVDSCAPLRKGVARSWKGCSQNSPLAFRQYR
uniref:Uncharacterized protein n=1 Tax=Anopheles dirus TaxID=7168 RepID=A0A182NX25_9DIPT